MAELQQFPHGHLLQCFSAPNQHLVAQYLTLLQARQYSPLTLERIIRTLKAFCHALPTPRRIVITQDLAQTTAEDIDTWIQAAQNKGLAPATIHVALGTLRQVFAFLIDEGHLIRQPIRRHRHHIILPQHLPRPMAEADIVAFFHVIDAVRDRFMFLLMLRCGLRVREVQHLTWAVVNSEAGSIRIDNAKGQVDRVVYYTPDVEHALRQWHGLQIGDAHYVFPSHYVRKAGQPISNRLIQHLMTTYCQKAQLTTRYSSHSLRHSFATILLNGGASLDVVKELMGHRSIDMTLRYTQLYDHTKRQQYDQAMAQLERRQTIGRV